MWRLKLPARFGLTILGVEIIPETDIIDPRSPAAIKLEEQSKMISQTETGWDRVKAIFKKDEFNALSPELDAITSSASIGLFVGLFLGGIPASKLEYEDFIRRNKASSFESHFDAKARLQHNVTVAMAKGGWRVGWRLGLFTGTFMFFTIAVSTYRGKSSVFEYTAGGLLAGCLYKLPMGPKAMISGGILGSVLGTGAGVVSVGLMTLSGTTTEEILKWRRWKAAETREISASKYKTIDEKNYHLSLIHDLDIAKQGRIESSLDKLGEEDLTKQSSKTPESKSPDINSVV